MFIRFCIRCFNAISNLLLRMEYISGMAHENHFDIPSLQSMQKTNVVREALIEKLEKVGVARLSLERERELLKRQVESLSVKIQVLDSEVQQLRQAMQVFDGRVLPLVMNELEAGRASYVHWNERKTVDTALERTHDAHAVITRRPTNRDSKVKDQVIAMVKSILGVTGPISTFKLFEILAMQDIEISSKERLSQILSETDAFESDRTKGWTLKG